MRGRAPDGAGGAPDGAGGGPDGAGDTPAGAGPEVVLIAAVAAGHTGRGAIGRAGALPWHLPADLARFKALTTGHAVLMGRRTWESLPARVRPLPGRRNLVLSRQPGFAAPGAEVATDVEAAMHALRGAPVVFGIGGEAVYAALLPHAARLELTEVQLEVPDADAFFPPTERGAFREVHRQHHPAADGAPAHAFVTWCRVAPPAPLREVKDET